MEVSAAYGAASAYTPLSFNFNRGTKNLFHSQVPILTTTKGRTKSLSLVNASRQTLSSNWVVSDDLSASTTSPWLPRFEELDTTNMLLRQRIIFLGSQVLSLSLSLCIINFGFCSCCFKYLIWRVPFVSLLIFSGEICKLLHVGSFKACYNKRMNKQRRKREIDVIVLNCWLFWYLKSTLFVLVNVFW